MSTMQGIAAVLIVIALYGWGATLDGADRLTGGAITAAAAAACSGPASARHTRGAP
ncbi:hypothetical protein [Variovorax boronicumulans]